MSTMRNDDHCSKQSIIFYLRKHDVCNKQAPIIAIDVTADALGERLDKEVRIYSKVA
jgi:hypothetical protein